MSLETQVITAPIFPTHSMRILEKWEKGPQLVVPSYQFPKESRLWGILREVVTARNTMLHLKAEMEMNGESKYLGASIFRSDVNQSTWLKQVANLPTELYHMLIKQLPPPNNPHIVLSLVLVFPNHAILPKEHYALKDYLKS